jgi:hypothetical protein
VTARTALLTIHLAAVAAWLLLVAILAMVDHWKT